MYSLIFDVNSDKVACASSKFVATKIAGFFKIGIDSKLSSGAVFYEYSSSSSSVSLGCQQRALDGG